MSDARPKVAFVADTVSTCYGGEALLPLQYLRILRQSGIDAWLICHERGYEDIAENLPEIREWVIPIRETPIHKVLFLLGRLLPSRIDMMTLSVISTLYTQFLSRLHLRRLVREHQVNIIHQPTPVSPKVPSFIYNIGAPVVIGPMNGGMTYPDESPFTDGKAVDIFVWLICIWADIANLIIPGKRKARMLLVANTRTAEAIPHTIKHVPIQQIAENGVDLTLWSRPDTVPAPHEGIVFVFMGRLCALKCVDLLLKAFCKVSETSDATLKIIGDGEERQALERLASDLGISNRVHFLGFLSQPACREQLSEADCLVLPSMRECGGAVVLEAMAMHLPVIATAWGGPVDYLDNTCGILIEPGKRDVFITRLSEAMRHLADTPSLRRSMGENGHRKVTEQYCWHAKVRQILDVYQNVIEQE